MFQSDDPLNAGDSLLERAAARGDAPLLLTDEGALSGLALRTRAIAVQNALASAGLVPGDRVLLLLLDTPFFHAAFLGAMRGGLIPIPVSTMLPEKDVAFIARDAGVRAAMIDAALPEALCQSGLFPSDCLVASSEDARWFGAPATPAPHPTRAGDTAFWLYTSGTTGEPKGVLHRHGDLPATADLYAKEILSLGPKDRVLSAAKLFFAYGLGNALTFPLWLGAECALVADRPTPERMFEAIAHFKPTIFFGVPTLYAAMLAHDAPADALASVRLCASAGEALAAPLYEAWRERFGVEILDGIGSTEMLHIFLSNRAGEVVPGSSGRPVPGYAVRIVDDEGKDVAQGDVGTLLAGGPSASPAYHDRPEQTATTMFEPGWLRSGDSYKQNPDGSYSHFGRSDDLIKVSGQYVSPVEVEGLLAGHPAVLEAAVVAQADEYELLKPKAYVVLQEGTPGDALAQELQNYVKERTAPHKYPRWIEFVDALPKTATGKIRRFTLRK